MMLIKIILKIQQVMEINVYLHFENIFQEMKY